MRCLLCSYPFQWGQKTVPIFDLGFAHSFCADKRHLKSIVVAAVINNFLVSPQFRNAKAGEVRKQMDEILNKEWAN